MPVTPPRRGRVTQAIQSLADVTALLQAQEADCAGLADAAEECHALLSGAEYHDGALRDKARRKLHLALAGKHLEPLARMFGHVRALREDVNIVARVSKVIDALDSYEAALGGRRES